MGRGLLGCRPSMRRCRRGTGSPGPHPRAHTHTHTHTRTRTHARIRVGRQPFLRFFAQNPIPIPPRMPSTLRLYPLSLARLAALQLKRSRAPQVCQPPACRRRRTAARPARRCRRGRRAWACCGAGDVMQRRARAVCMHHPRLKKTNRDGAAAALGRSVVARAGRHSG